MKRTECRSPATGELLGDSKENTVEELRDAVQKASGIQKSWAKSGLGRRKGAILLVKDYMVNHADELAEIISRDNGKTRLEALTTEVAPAIMAADYYTRRAGCFLKDQRIWPGHWLTANKASKMVRAPYGVVGIISPWNYPFGIPFSEVVMALLAGNAVVLKTATETQMVGRALEKCFDRAGLPQGLFTFINLPGRVAGDAFLEAGIDKLFFTGSVEVGKKLMAKAAETLTPVCLELGGNDAMLVCPDADIERAASGALWAGFQNAGQSCGGVERIYVHESVYQLFVDLLADKVNKLRVGPDVDHRVDMGAMTTSRQIQTVEDHIRDALEKGAVVYAQSRVPETGDGLFAPAVLLTEVTHDMKVMAEETFGPVVGVMKVKDMDEAIELANDSNLGLTGSVWSRDCRAADQLARRIQAGVVTINDHLMSHGLPETTWGGFKESGIGRTHGRIGFDEMTQSQCLIHDLMPKVKKNLWWHPYGPNVYQGMRGLVDFLFSRNPGRKIKGTGALFRLLPRIFKAD